MNPFEKKRFSIVSPADAPITAGEERSPFSISIIPAGESPATAEISGAERSSISITGESPANPFAAGQKHFSIAPAATSPASVAAPDTAGPAAVSAPIISPVGADFLDRVTSGLRELGGLPPPAPPAYEGPVRPFGETAPPRSVLDRSGADYSDNPNSALAKLAQQIPTTGDSAKDATNVLNARTKQLTEDPLGRNARAAAADEENVFTAKFGFDRSSSRRPIDNAFGTNPAGAQPLAAATRPIIVAGDYSIAARDKERADVFAARDKERAGVTSPTAGGASPLRPIKPGDRRGGSPPPQAGPLPLEDAEKLLGEGQSYRESGGGNVFQGVMEKARKRGLAK